MKKALFFAVAVLTPICVIGSVNASEKEKSRTRGNQASFSTYKSDPCGYEGISVWVFEEYEQGKEITYDAVYVDYYGYDYCNGTSKSGYAMVEGASFELDNLKSAFLSASGVLEIYSCTYAIPFFNGDLSDFIMDAGATGDGAIGDGGTGDDGGVPPEPCSFSYAPFIVNIEWTGTGEIYTERSTNIYNTPYSRYRSTYKGRSCDATVAGAFQIDSETIDLATGYGSLSESSSGEFLIYR